MAGSMVMLSAVLSIVHHPYWIGLTIFVGFNMFQSAFTGFCLPGIVMKKMGMKTESEKALEQKSDKL